MSEDNRMRWRTNPAVIAQYFTAEEIPKDKEVHLKPNEACAVIENGSIVGVATSTKLNVNPKLGLLSRLLNKKEPHRSFMFVHTGPHEILVALNGRWSDGESGKGIAGLKVSFDPDSLGRMLDFPSKGINTVTPGNIARKIEVEISQKFASKEMTQVASSAASSDAESIIMLDAGLRQVASQPMADLGGNVERVWLSWNESEYERIQRMQNELETLVAEGRIMDQKDQEELRNMIDKQIRTVEAEHQLKVTVKEYEAKETVMDSIARTRARVEMEDEQWKITLERARRDRAFEDEKVGHEREKEKGNIIHNMDIDSLRQQQAEKNREWQKEQEMKELAHKLEKGKFAAEQSGFFDDDN